MSKNPVQSGASGGAQPEELLYSLEKAARRIGGITPRQLAEKLRAGEMEGYKPNRSWRLSEANILAFVESCRRPPRPKATPASGEGSKASETPTPRRSKNRSPDASEEQFSLFDDNNSDD